MKCKLQIIDGTEILTVNEQFDLIINDMTIKELLEILSIQGHIEYEIKRK